MNRFPWAAWAALSLTLWAGVMIPQVLPWDPQASDWSAFLPSENPGDEYIYTARLNRFAELGRFPGNPYLRESAGDPPYQRFLDTAVLRVIAAPFLGRLKAAYAWIGLVFCLLMTAALLLLLRSTGAAAGWVLLGTAAIAVFGNQENMNRMICHQADNLPVLTLGLLALRSLFAGAGPSRNWVVAAALSGAAVAYGYPFYAVYFHAFLGLLLLERLAAGDKRGAAAFGTALAASLALATPLFLHQVELMRRPDFAAIQARVGFLSTRFPSLLGSAEILAGAALSLPFLPGRERVFYGLAYSAALLCLNQHVVTGRYIVQNTDHFHHAFRLMIGMSLVHAASLRWPRPGRVVAAAAVLALAWFGVRQWRVAHAPDRLRFIAEVREYRGALDWLKANAERGDVIVAAEPTTSFIAAHTPFFVFTADYAYLSLVTDRELLERALCQLKFFGLPESDLRRFAQENFLMLWGTGYPSVLSRARIMNLVQRWTGLGETFDTEAYKDLRVADLAADFRRFDPKPAFLGYRADFVLVGPWERRAYPTFSPSGRPIERVYQDPSVSVWRVSSGKK